MRAPSIGGLGGQPQLQQLRQRKQQLYAPVEAMKSFDEQNAARYTQRSIMSETQEELRKGFPQLVEQATALRQKGSLREARAAAAFGSIAETTMGGAYGWSLTTQVLPELDAELRKKMTESEPRLAKKLDLVLHDVSLPEALEKVAAQTGLPIELVAGSEEDARALLRRRALRIPYLDLRHATVVQAMDWILQPLAMEWRTGEKGIVASTARRAECPSPWVYDVSALVTPTSEELADEKDPRVRAQKTVGAMTQLSSMTAKTLKLEEGHLIWVGPGQLALFGPPATHEAAARFFAALADPKAELPEATPVTEIFREACSKRAAANEKTQAGAQVLLEGRRTLETLRLFGPRLLAEAAGGKLDPEALAEMQVAWQEPALEELVKKARLDLVRTFWQLQESAALLPKETALATLVAQARKSVQPAIDEALAPKEDGPRAYEAFLTVLYAALTQPADAASRKEARNSLKGWKGVTPSLQLVADALLAPVGEIDAGGLVKVLSEYVQGDDAVLLVALACRRAGSETWDAFRAAQQFLLGQQPLDGNTVVLVNRLSQVEMPGLGK